MPIRAVMLNFGYAEVSYLGSTIWFHESKEFETTEAAVKDLANELYRGWAETDYKYGMHPRFSKDHLAVQSWFETMPSWTWQDAPEVGLGTWTVPWAGAIKQFVLTDQIGIVEDNAEVELVESIEGLVWVGKVREDGAITCPNCHLPVESFCGFCKKEIVNPCSFSDARMCGICSKPRTERPGRYCSRYHDLRMPIHALLD